MITQRQIEKIATKWQTTELNVRREYLQHLFLSYFYQQPHAKRVLFKGGTALRLIYNSPRFSEDLDFSAKGINIKDLEQTIINTLDEIERENINISIKEAKTTSGGYLAHVIFEAQEFQPVVIELEVSLRNAKLNGEVTTVSGDFLPPFTVFYLSLEQLLDEKIQALLYRKKPRDFYDLYFILRSNLLLTKKKEVLPKVLKTIKGTNINFGKELKQFLPKTHWPIIRNFKQTLEREIQRFI
ncbi:MAG: nucleotidyl transferase AbiEii/AbiGii toxin family protein [Patescibacteria group bacterium]